MFARSVIASRNSESLTPPSENLINTALYWLYEKVIGIRNVGKPSCLSIAVDWMKISILTKRFQTNCAIWRLWCSVRMHSDKVAGESDLPSGRRRRPRPRRRWRTSPRTRPRRDARRKTPSSTSWQNYFRFRRPSPVSWTRRPLYDWPPATWKWELSFQTVSASLHTLMVFSN